MEKNTGVITFITSLSCNSLDEGHIIYFFNYIKDLKKYYLINILCEQHNGNVFKNIENVNVFDCLTKSNKFGLATFSNFITIKKKSIGIVHFWYAPRLMYFPLLFNNTIFYSLPDSWSSYYASQLKVKKNIALFSRFIYYKLFERIISFSKIKTIYVSHSDAKKYNGLFIPFKISKHVGNSNSKEGVLVGRMNSIILEKIIINLILNNTNINFTIISKDNGIHEKYSSNKNITFIKWVEDYENFSSKFKVHLLYDLWGSGQSTKLINCLNVGSLAIGNEISFRGFSKNNKDHKYIGKDFNRLNNLLDLINKYNSDELNKEIIKQREYFLNMTKFVNTKEFFINMYNLN
jgi:hypothetical protein